MYLLPQFTAMVAAALQVFPLAQQAALRTLGRATPLTTVLVAAGGHKVAESGHDTCPAADGRSNLCTCTLTSHDHLTCPCTGVGTNTGSNMLRIATRYLLYVLHCRN